jgi:hypothetical protein
MKTFKVMAAIILFASLLMYCTKKDQIVAPVSVNNSELTAIKTTVAPTIDGSIDAAWANANQISFTPTVPDPGNGLFASYVGDKYPTKLKAMYDDQYVYFLAEYNDADQSQRLAPWYYNPTTKLWAKEATSRTVDASGNITRQGFGEDKIAFLWNVDNSTPKFTTQTCYASCHVFTSYMDYSTATPTLKSNSASGNHYTNGPTEKIDMWWMQPSKGLSYGKMDDNYQDWAGGPAITNLTGGNANGRHVDDIYPDGTASTTWPYRPNYTVADPTQASFANTQTIKITGTTTSVSVPTWVIPGSTSDYITVADTASGKAKKITAVDSLGVLTYTGGTIDPKTGTGYQRVGGGVGANCIPSVVVQPLKSGRSDIDCVTTYTGTGYVVEIRRKLKSDNSALKQDVDFSTLEDQPFGFAVWDKSNYQHAIQPNLKLIFKKATTN